MLSSHPRSDLNCKLGGGNNWYRGGRKELRNCVIIAELNVSDRGFGGARIYCNAPQRGNGKSIDLFPRFPLIKPIGQQQRRQQQRRTGIGGGDWNIKKVQGVFFSTLICKYPEDRPIHLVFA